MTGLSWASLSTPVGPVSVGCSEAGVARIRYGRPTIATRGERGRPRPDEHTGELREAVPPAEHSAAARFAEAASAELVEYFRGDRQTFEVPVDWATTAGPQRQVLMVLAETVGYGQTISYGALARRARLSADPAPARAVGTIMATNPIPVVVPCHRVLASDGIGGYSGGSGVEVKRWLLILEGSQPPTLDWDARGCDQASRSG